MRARRSFYCGAAALWLGGCNLVGPVVNPAIERGGERACLSGTEPPPAEAADSCLRIMVRNPNGGFSPATLTTLNAGDAIYAFPAGGCAGNYNHAVVIADVAANEQGRGSATLAVPDAIGRQTAHREFQWSAGQTGRRWVLSDIKTPLQIPNNIVVAVHEGTVDIREICYANYG